MNQNTNPLINVEFCRGIDANIVKDTTKILPWDAVKDIISKQTPENNLYEVTKPNKPIKIFIDIDGEASQNITQSKFNIIVNSIMNQLSQLDCAVMNSSKYEHTYTDNDGKEKVSNKYSFRLTFHKYISCISKMVAIVENEYYPMLKNELKDIIDIDFGNKTEDCLNIDKAVYRTKGVGKMRCPNAYKGKTNCFKNNHFNSFEYDRPNHIVIGSVEDNLIHYIDPNDEFIDIKDEPVENKIIEKQEKKTKTDDDNDTQTTIDCDVEALLDLIDVEYLSEYKDWTKILWAGKACGVDKEFLRKISMKSEKYNDNAFDKTYNGYNEPTNTIATIKYYAKLSNKDKYYDIVTKQNCDKFDIHTFVSIQSKLHIEELEKNKDLSDYSNTKKKEIKEKMKQLEQEHMEDLYNKRKLYFEKFYSKIMEPSIYANVHEGNVSILGDKDIKHQTNNAKIGKYKFIDLWTSDINIKTYDTLDFLPPPCVCDKNILNTFTGFKIQNMIEYEDKQHDYQIFLDHLKAITGNDEKCYDYMIKYLAHMLQRPGEKMDVAIVIRSVQGIGKNIFFDNFGKYIIGDKYFLQTANIDKVIGRFNQNVNKIMVIMDEMSGKDGFTNSDVLKNLITSTELNWERKGVDGVTIRNLARYFFFTNGDTPLKIEQTDRRFVAMEGQDTFKGNHAHFKKLDESFKDEKCCKDFYDYLMSIDLSEWNWRDRPITAAYKDMQSATIPNMALFLGDLCEKYVEVQNGDDDDDVDSKILTLNTMKKYKSNELYSLYKKFIEQYCGGKGELTLTKYGREIMKYGGIEKKKSMGINVIQIDYEVLHEHLEKNGLLI